MYMKKNIVLTFSFIAVAVVAMIASLCFLFLGNDVIEGVPSAVKVHQEDGKVSLVTDYREGCFYQFKLEQMIDGQYIVVDLVTSATNTVDLADHALSVVAGEKYRFSACFATENGAGNGEFCKALEWQPSWMLEQVSYDTMTFENSRLSWGMVSDAESYEVRTIDAAGIVKRKTVVLPRIDLDLEVGKYRIFVVAKSSNEFVFDSIVGNGKEIVVEKKNQITEARIKTNGQLRILCSQSVGNFQVFVDGVLFTEFEGTGKTYLGQYEYTFADVDVFFSTIDFDACEVEIKSLGEKYVLESDFVALEKD